MNLVAGDLEPTAGDARRSIKLRVGRYAQHFVDALSMEDTPVEYLRSRYGSMRKEDGSELKEHDVRAMLGRFGLAGHHHHQVHVLATRLFLTVVAVWRGRPSADPSALWCALRRCVGLLHACGKQMCTYMKSMLLCYKNVDKCSAIICILASWRL